ncbi:hypothetical protein MXMO3_01716 [Maritalea myrionectae]|uniref:Uncharacterized protein n=1 Tax=Maritalea myrionectae TaxID=454601 RepID=A0A2R4ME05_9HYPH|nr:hypothetical protein MXMO3_01716 [Maritalea myrionectae]
MRNILDSLTSLAILALFLLAYFPGGTIVMGVSCDTDDLAWFDWLFSVILPGYGLIRAIFGC